jgi:hypothetical protein
VTRSREALPQLGRSLFTVNVGVHIMWLRRLGAMATQSMHKYHLFSPPLAMQAHKRGVFTRLVCQPTQSGPCNHPSANKAGQTPNAVCILLGGGDDGVWWASLRHHVLPLLLRMLPRRWREKKACNTVSASFQKQARGVLVEGTIATGP